MPEVIVHKDSNASPAAAWALLKDFARIDAFNPTLSRSYSLDGGPETGLGATRQCDLKDGKNFLKERVVDWTEGEGYVVDIYETTMPLRDVQAQLKVSPKGDGSRLTMRISYTPRFGLLGTLLNAVVLRRTMEKTMARVVNGLHQRATGQVLAA